MLDEVRQAGNTPQTAARSALPYRRHIVGLPLQRSLFGQAARAATTIGLPGLTSELNFPARLDENGDLFLDRSQVAALTKALSSQLTPETLERMHATHAAACNALSDARKNAVRAVASFDGDSKKMAEDLAKKMALVLAYGILSKFVPDVLLRALADVGDVEPPPFPEKSAGAELMQNTFGLYEACCALDYSPERLLREWSRVPPQVFHLVTEFCNQQTGLVRSPGTRPGMKIRFMSLGCFTRPLMRSTRNKFAVVYLSVEDPQSLRPLPVRERKSLFSGACLGFGWNFWNGKRGMCAVRFTST